MGVSPGGTYLPKKLATRLHDKTGGINWSTVAGKVFTANGYTWHKPGSQNPRK